MTLTQINKYLFILTSICVLVVVSGSTVNAQERRSSQPREDKARSSVGGQRLAPPSALKCSRDHLTSFTGRVLAYQRSTSRIFIRVRTDEETTENFTLRFEKKDDPPKWLLLRGEPFKQSDWELIESSPGKLKPKMRATVWVCDDGSKPVIDWRPPE